MILMKSRNRNYLAISLIFVAISLCFYITPAIAGGDTHQASNDGAQPVASEGGHGGDRTDDLLDLLYRFMNFALLVIILVWALKKVGIKDFFAARTEEIKNRLDDLKKEKETFELQYRELEKKLKAFEQEKEEIITQYKEEGEAEKNKIIAEAKERVDQILKQAELTINQEMQSAKDRLKQEVVDLAAREAQKMISEGIKEADQDHLVDEFIERLGNIH